MAIAGIYSFPKSGNTWVRAILSQLFDGRILAIPDLHKKTIESAEQARGFRFYKHHSGSLIRKSGGVIFDTTHVVHIRRNPLDVFMSYMNYRSNKISGNAFIPFDDIESIHGTELFDLYFSTFVITTHVDQMHKVTKGYFSHNRNWLAAAEKNPNIKCIRYEDLLTDAVSTLGFLEEWLGLSAGELEEMVRLGGKKTSIDGKFFWKQKERNYLDYLRPEQIETFLRYRLKDCEEIGYSRDYWNI